MAEYLTFEQLQHWPAIAASYAPPARLAVIGDPIGHSKSPQMHNPALRARGIDAQYVRVQVPVGRVKEAFGLFRDHGFVGVNITIPHKFEALEAVDEVDPLARMLGAVNTLAIRNGRLFGYNTDGPGFLASVAEAFSMNVAGKRVLILGAGGGAGRAVAIQCALSGAQLLLANRTQAKAHQVRQEIEHLCPQASVRVVEPDRNDGTLAGADAVRDAELIVNATASGMKSEDSPLIPTGCLAAGQGVFDMVYRAAGQTPLIQAANAAGCRHVDGMTLLLHQGAISFAHWFGDPVPLEVMRQGLLTA